MPALTVPTITTTTHHTPAFQSTAQDPAALRTTVVVDTHTTIIDGIGKPFYCGGVPRFLDRFLDRFGRCTTIKNIRRYTPVKGIVVRQVGARGYACQFASEG